MILVMKTSDQARQRGGAPAGLTQRKLKHDFSTFLPRCLPEFLPREEFNRHFSSSTVNSNFVYPQINRAPPVGHDFFIFYFIFCGEKPNSYDCTKIRTHVPKSESFEVTN